MNIVAPAAAGLPVLNAAGAIVAPLPNQALLPAPAAIAPVPARQQLAIPTISAPASTVIAPPPASQQPAIPTIPAPATGLAPGPAPGPILAPGPAPVPVPTPDPATSTSAATAPSIDMSTPTDTAPNQLQHDTAMQDSARDPVSLESPIDSRVVELALAGELGLGFQQMARNNQEMALNIQQLSVEIKQLKRANESDGANGRPKRVRREDEASADEETADE